MKRITGIATLILAFCLLLSVASFAAAEPAAASAEPAAETGASAEASAEPAGIQPGTYEANGNTLIIAEDMSFEMYKMGENTDGTGFEMKIVGLVENEAFVITAIYDGELDVFSLATESQIEGDLAAIEETYAAASASAEPSGEASAEPAAEEDLFELFREYLRSMLNPDGENNDEFIVAVDIVTEETYDPTAMPFEMFISFGGLDYEGFVEYYNANGTIPPAVTY